MIKRDQLCVIAPAVMPLLHNAANHYRIALGSAAETCSVLDLVVLPEGEEQQQKLRRVGVMLRQMVR